MILAAEKNVCTSCGGNGTAPTTATDDCGCTDYIHAHDQTCLCVCSMFNLACDMPEYIEPQKVISRPVKKIAMPHKRTCKINSPAGGWFFHKH